MHHRILITWIVGAGWLFASLAFLWADDVTNTPPALAGKLATLTKLSLKNTRVTDAGTAKLEGLPKLATLDLAGTKITDATLGTLAKLPALKAIDLSFTALSDAAVAKFRDSHPGVKVVR